MMRQDVAGERGGHAVEWQIEQQYCLRDFCFLSHHIILIILVLVAWHGTAGNT